MVGAQRGTAHAVHALCFTPDQTPVLYVGHLFLLFVGGSGIMMRADCERHVDPVETWWNSIGNRRKTRLRGCSALCPKPSGGARGLLFLPCRQGCIRREGAEGWPQKQLDRRLEEVAKAVGGGYCRLQMPLKTALGARKTVLGVGWAPWRGAGVPSPLPMHPTSSCRLGRVDLPGGFTAVASVLAGWWDECPGLCAC